MMRALFTILSFVSAIFFPWPLTALLALCVSFVEPFLPLAVGIFLDTLHYTTGVSDVPLFTLYGALATFLAFSVRSRLQTGTIGR